ncbi:hypothetical protein TWF225_010695 [Orbilia oligospora]|nr:hypothetical protein TWF751_002930 [Orbilia oligospora]KAF3170956.1 hypothetical protein TWF225_010695 [Orbilia oligospora]KAF3240629.1 hypothetical protein TWF128_011244 [Orbilia oligospora]KAF3243671.1 hypothetical protein TWF217_011180 [Orbilia oligospora]KAF3281852.1 hypothetical protein TWF132_011074 [Orbilia oligospora]
MENIPPISNRFPGITPETIVYILPVTGSVTAFVDEPNNAERAKDIPIYYEERGAGNLNRGLELCWNRPPESIERGFRFGSDPDCEVYLPDTHPDLGELAVSRVHCRIHFNSASGLLLLTDSSRDGTYISNGGGMIKELKAEAPTTVLESKWTIRIADVYRFSVIIPWDNSNYEHYIQKLKERLPTAQYAPQPTPFKNSNFEPASDQKYRKWKPLSQGNFGKVSLFVDRSSGDLVAGKKFLKYKEGLNEIKILKQLRHPAIIRIIDIFCSQWKQDILIMEYSPHGDISNFDLLGWSEADKLESFRQLLSGLKYLHRNRIMHRDIKLENILLISRSPPVLKYVDFGLSKLVTPQMTPLGTFTYLAPEYFNKEGISFPADVWALGITFLLFYFDKDGVLKFAPTMGNQKPIWPSQVRNYAKDIKYLPSQILLRGMTAHSQSTRWNAKQALEYVQDEVARLSAGTPGNSVCGQKRRRCSDKHIDNEEVTTVKSTSLVKETSQAKETQQLEKVMPVEAINPVEKKPSGTDVAPAKKRQRLSWWSWWGSFY